MQIHISAGTRFILAFLHLSAGIVESFGNAVINMLHKQFPEMLDDMAEDEKYRENPGATIGTKMVIIARGQLQYNDQDAYDAIQDVLTYMTSKNYDFRARTKKNKEGAKTWREALNFVYSNVRRRALSISKRQKHRKEPATDAAKFADMLWRRDQALGDKSKVKWTDEDDFKLQTLAESLKRQGIDIKNITPKKLSQRSMYRTIDEAFGVRGEEGGDPSGGEERIPQPQDVPFGLPSDVKKSERDFMQVVSDMLPDLMDNLPLTKEGLPAQALLLEFFMETGIGHLIPKVMERRTEVKEVGEEEINMNQSAGFKYWLESLAKRNTETEEQRKQRIEYEKSIGKYVDWKYEAGKSKAHAAKAILDRWAGGRWYGFVADTKKRLVKNIGEFVEKYLPESEYEVLWDEFFSDVTPEKAEKFQRMEEKRAISINRQQDIMNLIRAQERDKYGLLSQKGISDMNKLRKDITKEIKEEHDKDMVAWKQAMEKYMTKMMKYSDLPLEEQPKIERPKKPPKEPMSLDEHMKAVMAIYGDKIQKEVKKEFDDSVKESLKKKKSEEMAEEYVEGKLPPKRPGQYPSRREEEIAREIAEEAIGQVDTDTRKAISSFLKKFVPAFVPEFV